MNKKIVRLIVAATALVLFAIGAAVLALPHFFRIDRGARIRTVDVGSLREATRLEGSDSEGGALRGFENVLPAADGETVFASTLGGWVAAFEPDPGRPGAFRATAARKVGDYALGLALAPDGRLFAAASSGGMKGWLGGESSIVELDPGAGLAELRRTPVRRPGLNGLAFDSGGDLWFASSDFNFLAPRGSLWRAPGGRTEEAREVLRGGLFNGVHASADGSVYAADTLNAVYRLPRGFAADAASLPASGAALEDLLAYRKAAFAEAFDDICLDSRGRLWKADPLFRGIARIDPAARTATRFGLPGFGYASAVKARTEGGREWLYVSELRSPDGKGMDGRFVLRVAVDELEAAE